MEQIEDLSADATFAPVGSSTRPAPGSPGWMARGRMNREEATTTDDTPAVQCEGLTKDFGEQRAVDRIDLTVPRGSVFGFLGPNGAGKTTTIRMLATLSPPSGGRAQCWATTSFPKQQRCAARSA